MLLDPMYIKNEKSDGVDAWRKFLEQIGIHTGIAVQQVEIHIAEVRTVYMSYRCRFVHSIHLFF